MKKNIVFALSFVALAIFNTVSCNSGKFTDYTKESNVKLTLDYKGKDFYKDSIEQVNVAYYIDGDTTHFKSINNNTPNIKIRYYGIDTPESTGKIEEYGEEAKQFTKAKLKNAVENGTVVISGPTMEYGEPITDSTGSRYLGLVWINETEKNASYDSLICLNLYIVQEGLSYVKSLDKIPEYVDTFLKAEEQAKRFKLNLHSGKPAELFNYGAYEAISLLEIRRAIEADLKEGIPNPYSGRKVRLRGTVTSYCNSMLYIASYFDEATGSTNPHGEWAGINIYTGTGSIPSKYTTKNTYIEVAGTLSDSEEFGFQMSGCDFTRSTFDPIEDADTNKAQVIYKADETPEEFRVSPFVMSASELGAASSDKLFMEVEVKETLTCYDAYKNDSGEFTLYFEDQNGTKTPFNMFVPSIYYPDPENQPYYSYSTEEEFEGKKFKVRGLYTFRKYNGKVSYQLVMRPHKEGEPLDLTIVE